MSTTATDLAIELSSKDLLRTLNEKIETWNHELGTLAVMSNMTLVTLRRKLAGYSPFTFNELDMVCGVLGINVSELYTDDAPTVTSEVVATPTPEAAAEPLRCTAYSWCDITDRDHDGDSFHQESGITVIERGVLRTDHVVEDGVVKLDVTESFAWIVDADESEEFFKTLRAAIDTAEAKFEEFKARVQAGGER